MASLFGPSVLGNTGIMGTGMRSVMAPGIVGQTARRFNRRPDTPEEIYADQLARGEVPSGTAGPVGTGDTLFNQPQQFPGNTFGTNDWSRFFTYAANDLYNNLGPLVGQGQGLFTQGQDLYNQYGQLGNTAQLNQQLGNVGQFNTDVLGGRMPQAIAQLAAPYLAKASADINAQANTVRRQALDQLPRGGLAAEAVAGANDSAIKGIADVNSNLFGTLANTALTNALAGGNLAQGLSFLGQQGSALGQQGNLLGQIGNIIGQRGLAPAQIISNLITGLNQRRGVEATENASKGK